MANVADRVAQTAAAMLLEEKLEPIFHPDSYRYRPGRSAHDALAVARKRCWNKDWVLDLDVRAFFDSVGHDLLMRAVAHHTDERWVLLYIQRWLKAPMTMADGTTRRERWEPHKDLRSRRCSRTSSCTMGSTSGWTANTPAVRSSVTPMMWSSTATPSNRPNNSAPASLSGSGPWALSCIATRRRSCTAKTRTAVMRRSTPASTFSATPSGVVWPVADEAFFVSFSPAVSPKAKKAIGEQIRDWHLNRRSATDLAGLARAINARIRGWFNYYGAFYRSELYAIAARIDEHLVRWAMQKFKRLRGQPTKAWRWLDAARQREPQLFAHWHLLASTQRRTVGAV